MSHPAQVSRRRLLAGTIGASVLTLAAACSGTHDSASTDAKTSGMQSDATPGTGSPTGSVSVQDVFGPVTVPQESHRLVVLDQEVLGNALALGFPLERIIGWNRGTQPLTDFPHLTALGDIGRIPNIKSEFDKPDIEALLAVNPDLVLRVGLPSKADKDTFTKIRGAGLTAFCAFNGYLTVDEYMRLLHDTGVALRQEDKAKQLEASFRGDLAEVGRQLDAKGKRPSAAFLRVAPWDGSYLSVVVPHLDALKLPGKRPTTKQFYIALSGENLGQMTHDVLFVGDGGDRAKTQAALAKNRIFQQLPAVRAKRWMMVPDSTWGNGYSLPAIHAMLDDIKSLLLR